MDVNDEYFQGFDNSLSLLNSDNFKWKSNRQVVERNFELSIPVATPESGISW